MDRWLAWDKSVMKCCFYSVVNKECPIVTTVNSSFGIGYPTMRSRDGSRDSGWRFITAQTVNVNYRGSTNATTLNKWRGQ